MNTTALLANSTAAAKLSWRPVRSTWIAAVSTSGIPQSPNFNLNLVPRGYRFIHLKLKNGTTVSKLAPGWAYGLLLAAEKVEGRSVGRAYHRIVKRFAIEEV